MPFSLDYYMVDKTFSGFRCINGRYVGSVWTFLQGGSCIISPDVDHNENRLHGDQIAFLYPDMQTALIGSFDIHGNKIKLAMSKN